MTPWSYLRIVNNMSSNKEHLKLLLEFISKILEKDENDWFHDELALLISKKIISEKDTGIRLSAVTIKELGSIDKYLDEGIIPIIDYSQIPNERVRFQLERDAIEMGKCRLSNYESTISFEKFCKYAHFQSEELINYYYQKIADGDLNKAKSKIKEFNNSFKDEVGQNREPYRSLSSIPFKVKLYSISNNLKLSSPAKSVFINVSDVRNLELHRDSIGDIDTYLKSFISREDYNKIYESLIELKNRIIYSLK
jgi:hypothetical protein